MVLGCEVRRPERPAECHPPEGPVAGPRPTSKVHFLLSN
uniref:Uncharacterized protein n=1 Tax=Chlorocebus sabaeus TaxID=60711 RepID=A0A0D9S3L2_CHLSB